MEEIIELSKDVIDYCKSQLKKGCGSCKLISVCHVNHPTTLHHINQNTIKINNRFEEIRNHLNS